MTVTETGTGPCYDVPWSLGASNSACRAVYWHYRVQNEFVIISWVMKYILLKKRGEKKRKVFGGEFLN